MRKNKKSKNKPSLAYRTTKLCGQLFLIWPLDKNAKWVDRILRELFWWILLLNGSFLIIGIIIGTYYFYDEIDTITTLIFILFELTVVSENIYTSILFKVQEKRLRNLLTFFEKSLNDINSPAEILFRKYLKDSAPLTILIYTVYNSLAVGFIYLQIFKPTTILPKEIWHPFLTEPFSKKCLVIIQQSMYVLHTAVLHIGDGIGFMSMQIARAKLEVLSGELQQVGDEVQLKKCIQDHQEIIWFVNGINNTLRFIVLKTIFAAAFYLWLGFLQILRKSEGIDPLLMHQFLLMIAVVNYRIFFGALCADQLASTNDNLRFSIPWVGKSSKVTKSMYILIQRCQKPLSISVSGILPQYSLSYYASFLSFTFSYFLTLKAILKL